MPQRIPVVSVVQAVVVGEGVSECDQRLKRWIVLDVREVLQRADDRVVVGYGLLALGLEAGSDLVKEYQLTGRCQPTHRQPTR